jgi:Tim10/DDP family zinc finger
MLQNENSHPRHLSLWPTVTPRIPLRVCHPSVSAGALLCTLQFLGAGHIASLHVTVPPLAMNPSDLDALPKAEKDELLSIIESMQTRDRCARPPAACPREATELRGQPLLRVCPSHALRRSRSSLRMYNGLVERCFVSCVDTFRRKTLEKSEEVVRPADRS